MTSAKTYVTRPQCVNISRLSQNGLNFPDAFSNTFSWTEIIFDSTVTHVCSECPADSETVLVQIMDCNMHNSSLVMSVCYSPWPVMAMMVTQIILLGKSQKRRGHQLDCLGRHWERWSLPSTTRIDRHPDDHSVRFSDGFLVYIMYTINYAHGFVPFVHNILTRWITHILLDCMVSSYDCPNVACANSAWFG